MTGTAQTRETPKDTALPRTLADLASYVLNRIVFRHNQSVQEKLRAHGQITISIRVISTLSVYGTLTVNELCVHAMAEQPTMSRALDRMAANGLIERSISDTDSRVRVVRLTPEGRALSREFWPVMTGANEELLSALTPGERQTLMRLLTKVHHAMRKHPF